MACSHCGNPKVYVRGFCGPCYHRLRRSGSVARKNVQNLGRSCSREECSHPAYSKGLCIFHYERQQHPLRNTWKLIRSRYLSDVPDHWARFEAFLADVGERPGPRHQLRRLDEGAPYSATNIRWVAPVKKGTDSYTKEERAAYARDWRLRTQFKITLAEYDAMVKAQDGRCAICTGKEENSSLHVDHCHETGRVRGLLCIRCNRGLGYFLDNPAFLKSAIEYLS
jgi:hypothetical protein